MRQKSLLALLALTVLLAALPACNTTPARPAVPPSTRLAQAEQLFAQGRYTDAMICCVDLSRDAPDLPGLPQLKARIMQRLAELRLAGAAAGSAVSMRSMTADAESRKVLPGTYGLRRAVAGETSPLRTPPSTMETALKKKITVHLDGVTLSEFILAVGAADEINIIADTADDGATMTIHAEDVPLWEILDYVSRNLGMSFYVGENLIWATAEQPNQPRIPLETRMYRLRKGISGDELEDGGGNINIVEAIERFIPTTDGADVLFIRKGHLLIVKNTRQNLAAIEEIINTLDICPPQVLIEARFISTSIGDLRELGIDWILNSPIVTSRRKVLRDGGAVRAPETAVSPGSSVDFQEFANSSEGLNMTYQGLLTDPLFKAVLHALETSGKSRTLSVPRVTTVNNRVANIRIGRDFRYFEEYDIQSIPSSVTDSGSQVYSSVLVPVGSPQIEELGIELSVTPSVGADLNSITLNMQPKITEFERYETYQVGSGNNNNQGGNTTATNMTNSAMSMVKLPIFKTSEIDTELIVRSGETVVMGGLITTTEDRQVRRVPILSSIPLIGKLFIHEGIEERKENLLIFVTATILSQRGENLVPILARPATAPPPDGT